MSTVIESQAECGAPECTADAVRVTASPVGHCEVSAASEDCEHQTGCDTHPKVLTLADLHLFISAYGAGMIDDVTAHFPAGAPLRLLIDFCEAFSSETVTWTVDRDDLGAVRTVRATWSRL